MRITTNVPDEDETLLGDSDMVIDNFEGLLD